jgi:hypothetical protein
VKCIINEEYSFARIPGFRTLIAIRNDGVSYSLPAKAEALLLGFDFELAQACVLSPSHPLLRTGVLRCQLEDRIAESAHPKSSAYSIFSAHELSSLAGSALRILHWTKRSIVVSTGGGGRPTIFKARRRLPNELIYRALCLRLVDGPHTFIDRGERVYEAFDRVDGYRLDHLEMRLCRYPIEKVVRNIVRAVHRFHREGIAHGDLHPGNVLVERSGGATLIDFEAARFEGDDQGIPISGASLFAAPEVLAKSGCGVASDIFALGKILSYAMASSQRSLTLQQRKCLERAENVNPVKRPPIDDFLDAFCMKANQ